MGGGNNPLKSKNYHTKSSKSLFKNSFSKIDFKHQSKGAVLIEFAFCTPVLILLIYYMHDLFTIQRWYSQTEFVAYQMVQMIQSISQNRSDKKITLTDLKYIVSAAYLTIYPGTTMFSDSVGHVFGHFPHPFLYYVKGLDNGNASCIWRIQLHPAAKSCVSPQTMDGGVGHDNSAISVVQYKTDVPPSLIYPTLKIKPKEVKIIVETNIFYHHGSYYSFADGRTNVPAREAFGLYLITPPKTLARYNDHTYFHSVVIFSPNPDLFDEDGPKES